MPRRSSAKSRPIPATGMGDGRIVSSRHLVSERSPELSEVEFAMIIAWHAFARWMVRCMSTAGVRDTTPTDVLVLHHVAHLQSEKRLADICFVLNIEDTHVVSYSLRKLQGMGLVRSARRGKEAYFAITDAGIDLCLRYREIREACLMPGFTNASDENRRLGEMARLLRTLSGRYDQAARAASASGA